MNNELPRIERDPQLPGEYAATLREALDDTELERLEGILLWCSGLSGHAS